MNSVADLHNKLAVADLHSKMLDARPPGGPNSFNFMQFLGKFGKIVCWRPPPPGSWRPHLVEILDPPLTSVHFECILFEGLKFKWHLLCERQHETGLSEATYRGGSRWGL